MTTALDRRNFLGIIFGTAVTAAAIPMSSLLSSKVRLIGPDVLTADVDEWLTTTGLLSDKAMADGFSVKEMERELLKCLAKAFKDRGLRPIGKAGIRMEYSMDYCATMIVVDQKGCRR